MGENPMIADPDITHVDHALDNLEFLVVQDIFLTETAQKAHVVLPAACFAEGDGTQTNTERRVQRLRKAQDPPGEAKLDWQILAEVAAALGYEKQFAWKTYEDVFNEIALLTPSYHGMTYERLNKPEALHWPCPEADHPGTPILHTQQFNGMPEGKGLMTGITWKPPAEVPDDEYPFVLTTGRMLFHWHTGSMSRRSVRLDDEVPTGFVEVNDEDAARLGIKNGEIIRAFSRRGEIKVPALVTKDIKKGSIFIPFHFAECCANVLTNNALDPISKIPEFKACAANIAKLEA
jgi:formate dehydrogenase major subunit